MLNNDSYNNTGIHLAEHKERALAHLKILKYVYKSYIYLIYMYKEDLALNDLQ